MACTGKYKSLIILLLSLLISGAGNAKSSLFDIKLRLQNIYDDNIINYSDADLDQIDDPLAPDNKFAIKSKDDFIINPDIHVIYKTKLFRHSFHLGLRSGYYFYTENDIKRHWRFETYFKRFFRRGTYFQGSLTYLPDYYYRNSYVSGDGYLEAEFDKLLLRAKLAYKLSRNMQVNLVYTYSNKDFIPIFDERDINEHQFEAGFIYRPVKLWKGWLDYQYSHAIGAGADNPVYLRDTSFDHNLFTLGSRLYLKGLARKEFQIAVRGTLKFVQYQTTKITDEDRYRLGREDTRLYLYIMLKHYLKRGLSAEFRYKRYVKNIEIPASDLKDQLESSSNSLYLILNYDL